MIDPFRQRPQRTASENIHLSVHLVQFGIFGAIGRFRSVDRRHHKRQTRVICRTDRGLEVGTVLAMDDSANRSDGAGDLLRRVTPEDDLLINRIERFRDRAFEACRLLIENRGIQATLVDVEHLFDGQSVFFYFLGDVPAELESLTSELAQAYEAKVKFRKFADTLANGCGPDCGTGIGCGSEACQSCGVRTACKS